MAPKAGDSESTSSRSLRRRDTPTTGETPATEATLLEKDAGNKSKAQQTPGRKSAATPEPALTKVLSEVPSPPHSSAELRSNAETESRTVSSEFPITIRSPQFQAQVFQPRNIVINSEKRTEEVHEHFQTEKPSDGATFSYTSLEGLEAAGVFLSLTDDNVARIVDEYDFMRSTMLCDEEYATFARETFFLRQRRLKSYPIDRKWRAERVFHLVCSPEPLSSWQAPPLYPATVPTDGYKWDIHPDCAYWLSLTGFNSRYRSELQQAVFVHRDWITCPYLTVEFKKHNQSGAQALTQALTAAALALFNRFELKRKALEAEARNWSEGDAEMTRHYVITFFEARYTIWILLADVKDATWTGCTLGRLYTSACVSSASVRALESWINEIHRWGLQKHAGDCHGDMMRILEANGTDVSMMK
ncbi:hypothetical protein NA57DRAFT_30091 [Rhizodiscina lignyota]|uniref:Uncharacterized protein n=1 Tax=Rhizodiscina lignyota TaxID=1504668 RepID=A0A9P4MBH1_9PEZI|nr:hypothetical protein NA57DRAFT_30091 [Rhizodiscina lignyota]